MSSTKYHHEHTWLKTDGNTGIIGITDYAGQQLGEIVYVDLPNVGAQYDGGEIFGSVEALKTVSDLFMPVSGKITEVNNNLNKKPSLVNDEPFEGGWMVKIELTNPAEVNDLLTEEEYKQKQG